MSTETVTARRFAKMRPVPLVDAPPVDRAELPPGPHLHGLLQSIGLLRFRHQFVPYLRRRYGDVFSIKILPEGRHLVVFNRPEHVKEIFAGDPEVFHAGKGNAILGPVMGEHSLLLVDSAQHKRARRLLMPAFNGHALRGYEDLVTGLAKTEVGRWQEGVAFASLERMNALTLEVILQVVFGVTDEDRLGELRPLVNKTVNIPPLVFLGWGFPRLQKYGPWRRTIENQVELDRVMFRVISERRAASDLADRTDVLSRLLLVEDENGEGLTDEELRDQLVTLLLAGHETTATALAWTLHELGQDPVQERKARDAASAGNSEYLEAVLKESMRLHPVIPMVVRHLMAPATVGGVDLPRGANVAASIILAHESEERHPEHLRFRPERFLEGEVAINTWIPFGGGVRRCIGAGFSLMEGVAVLREVLTTYDVELPPGTTEVPKVRNITSVPRHGARIVVRRRAGA
ncbi:cytochrome P450 [Marmoricola sp. URHB0036]|uniref:cytochrome P450 n=1 Tax=Marmoricola sp. URHB0036 TaxID=1298863 RepID=UPI0003F8EC46|nr:cytochrome P450 [Marmoricola sp. URHB0036]